MARCRDCGAELTRDSLFCGNCGAPVPSQLPGDPGTAPTQAGVTTPRVTPMAAWLEVDSGPAQGREFQLRGTMRIGRTLDNEITVEDSQVSRHHAAISREPVGYILQDLNSSNGTFLNDQRVTEPCTLRDGDRIRVGNTSLIFCTMSAPTPEPQLPAPTPQPTITAQWQSPPAGTPAPPRAGARRRSGGAPVAVLVLGALLAVLVCAITATALYLALGKPDLSGRRAPPAAITQVVTSAPDQVVTVVVTSPPQATSKAEPVTVRVALDGSGDYERLEAAVEAVPPGSTILLAPGIHRLDRSLEITKPLSLQGAGLEETVVAGSEGDQVVLFTGPGSFVAEGITFRYEGSGWARVMTINEAEIEIFRCRFTGAVWSAEEKKGGDGILLWGNTTGSIRESRFEGNGLHGIELQDQAQPLIEGNVATGNGENGFVYFEESGGIARNNDCSGNGLHGIGVNEQAGPELEGNVCSDNEQVGIRFSDSATGTVRNNTCTGNGLHGISIGEEAQATLEGNNCSDNLELGIRVSDSATGTVLNNTCTANGLHGISVGEEAQATLEGNICSDNREVGIRFSDSATGTVRNNACIGNDLHGISVNDEAQPVLEENVCNDNKEVGIRFSDSSTGTARANQCSGNGLHGISVSGQAQPLLEDNICLGNIQVGIRFTDNSGGTARRNTCSANDLHGFQLKAQANATLEGNIARNNAEAGVLYLDGAGGVARQNVCTGNKWGIYVAETANPELIDNDCRENSEADVKDDR